MVESLGFYIYNQLWWCVWPGCDSLWEGQLAESTSGPDDGRVHGWANWLSGFVGGMTSGVKILLVIIKFRFSVSS